jgi:hypothetical protein
MATLPSYQTNDRTLEKLQSVWSTILNPFIANPALNGNILQNITLTTGANVINHKLGRKLQGWYIVRQRAASSIYDTQDSNQNPQLTLTLSASANVVVDIYVF